MNLNVYHSTLEHDVKHELRVNFTSHGTNIDQFSSVDDIEYNEEVRKLGKNIYSYLVKLDPSYLRSWVGTSKFDFTK